MKTYDEKIIEILPHGSGINCDWEHDQLKNGKHVFKNSFHLMNENGYYEGYQDFKITLEKGKETDFKFNFMNGMRRTNSSFGLKEYLEDTIYYSLDKLNK